MRLLKISQRIIFKEDAFSGIFKKGQEVRQEENATKI